MDDENEALDWGNEEEEQQESLRRDSYDQNGCRGYGDADDVEDTVSLGDDEDEQGIYSYQREDAPVSSHNAYNQNTSPSRPPSAQKHTEDMGANGYRTPQRNSDRTRRGEDPASQNSNRSQRSPRRRRRSTTRSPPQRPRVTHALPPKPVTTTVPYLPPSHPSIVAATSMIVVSPRAASRDPKKSNGASVVAVPLPDLPQNWDLRYPRNGGEPYYYNSETHESTWVLPVSHLPSSSSSQEEPRRGRRRSSSPGNTKMTLHDSNTHKSQTSRPNSDFPHHSTADYEMENPARPLTPDQSSLSYDDRHYRPIGDPASPSVEIRAIERIEISSGQPSRGRYLKSPVSPRQRRARSKTPPDLRGPPPPQQQHPKDKDYPSSRGQRSTRERNGYTNPDSTLQRDLEVIPSSAGYGNRHWEPQSAAVYSRDERKRERGSLPDQQSLRRQPDDIDMQLDEPYIMDSRGQPRPSMRRQESSRGYSRERDLPPRDSLSASGKQNYLSSSRPRSPPIIRDHDLRDRNRDYGRSGRNQDQRYTDSPPPPGRYYNEPPHSAPVTTSSRKDRDNRERPPRSDNLSKQNTNPNIGPRSAGIVGQETSLAYRRRSDYNCSPNIDIPRGRGPERERGLDQQRRDVPFREDNEYSRKHAHDTFMPNKASRPPPDSSRPRQYQEEYSRPPPDEVGPIRRQRAPLPPQQMTFLSSSTSTTANTALPAHPRDSPHAALPAAQPDRDRPGESSWGNQESALPRKPPFAPKAIETDRELNRRGRGQRNAYTPPPQPPLSKLDTRMENGFDEPPRSRQQYSPIETRNSRSGYRDLSDEYGLPANERIGGGGRNAPSSHTASRPPRDTISRPLDHGVPDKVFPPRPVSGTGFDDRREYDIRQQGERSDRRSDRDDRGSAKRDRAVPVSGTNNVPIGNRRILPPTPPPAGGNAPLVTQPLSAPPMPLPLMFNPDARPPPSTLINPAKAKDLPSGKESYERPPQLDLLEPPHRSRDYGHYRIPLPSERQHPSLSLPLDSRDANQPRFSDRNSKFGPPVLGDEGLRGHALSPRSSAVASREGRERLDDRHAKQPPISRELSLHSTTIEQSSTQLSDHGHHSDGRSDMTSRAGPSLHPEGRPVVPLESRFSDPVPSLPDTPVFPTQPSSKPVDGAQRRTRWGDSQGSSQPSATSFPVAMGDRSFTLARRLSTSTGTDRPPRHRKYPSDHITAPNLEPDIAAELPSNAFLPLPGGQVPGSVEEQQGIKDRLERPSVQRRGASLLDRLSSSVGDGVRPGGGQHQLPPLPPRDVQSPSLRERLVPSKRDRDDMAVDDRDSGEIGFGYNDEDGLDMKRRRRSGKGGRRSGGGGGGGRRFGA